MARTLTVKVPKDRLSDCVLVPLYRRKARFPVAQENVLPNTYYRVQKSAPNRVRAMVTIMPDGLHVAWTSCSKCKNPVQQCSCATGFYHPASIGWIRATYDHHDWPERSIMDYSEYYDPFMKREATPSTDTGRYTYQPPPARTPTKQKAADSITVEEVEAIDMAVLQKEAEKTAKKTTRAVRKVTKARRQ